MGNVEFLEMLMFLLILPIAKNCLSGLGEIVRENAKTKVKFALNIVFTLSIATFGYMVTKSMKGLIQSFVCLLFAVLFTIVVDKVNKKMEYTQDINEILGYMKFLVGFVTIIVTGILTGLSVIEPCATWQEGLSLVVFSYALPIVYVTGFSFTDKASELLTA